MSKKSKGISVNSDGTIDSGTQSSESTESESESESVDELANSVEEFLKACNSIVTVIGTKNVIYKLFWNYVGKEEKQRNVGEISDDCLKTYDTMRKKISGYSNENSKKVFKEWFKSETVVVGNFKNNKICLSTIYYTAEKEMKSVILEAFLKVVFFSMSLKIDKREMDRISYIYDLEMPKPDYTDMKDKFIEGIGFGFKNVRSEVIASIDKIKLPPPPGMVYGKKCQEAQKIKLERWEKGVEILENISTNTSETSVTPK